MPSLGGGGEYGGSDVAGGSGGSHGGGYGGGGGVDLGFGLASNMPEYGRLYGSEAEAQAEIDRANERARAAARSKRQALYDAIALVPVVGAPTAMIARTVDNLMYAFGLTRAEAQQAVQDRVAGKSPAEISASLYGKHGQEWIDQEMKNMGIPVKEATDPLSNNFWGQFVKEWQTAKENIQENDEFKKRQLQPAFDTYQQRLAGLSTEPTFSPITVGIDNFKTSFLPKRATTNANAILQSELAETDIMQPKKADMDYLSQLLSVAQFQKELQNRINVADIKAQRPGDSGTWLDAISDVIRVGSEATDLFKELFK